MIPVPTREASPMQKAWKRRCHPARRPAMKTPSATDVRSGGTRPSVSDTEVQAGCQQNVDEEPSPKEGTHWIDQILKLFHKSLPLFFNDTATIVIYTLSLHDALPI